MSNDPYSGYVGHDVDLVRKAMNALFPNHTIELVEDGTNPVPGVKPQRLRVFFNKNDRTVTKVTAG